MKKTTRTFTAETPVGTVTRRDSRPFRFVAVLESHTWCVGWACEKQVSPHHTAEFWSTSEAGALRSAKPLVGVNGFRLVGVYPCVEGQ